MSDIQIGKYGTCTVKGNVQELNLGVEYMVKAKEISDKYGVSPDNLFNLFN